MRLSALMAVCFVKRFARCGVSSIEAASGKARRRLNRGDRPDLYRIPLTRACNG